MTAVTFRKKTQRNTQSFIVFRFGTVRQKSAGLTGRRLDWNWLPFRSLNTWLLQRSLNKAQQIFPTQQHYEWRSWTLLTQHCTDAVGLALQNSEFWKWNESFRLLLGFSWNFLILQAWLYLALCFWCHASHFVCVSHIFCSCHPFLPLLGLFPIISCLPLPHVAFVSPTPSRLETCPWPFFLSLISISALLWRVEPAQRIVKAELVDYPQDEGPIRQENNQQSKICSVQ